MICPDCGIDHHPPAGPAVVVEPGPNENDVKIAEIEAGASVARAEIAVEERVVELAADNERLRGRIQGIEETLAVLSPPPPEPAEPVVVPVPDPPAPAGDIPPPPQTAPPKTSKSGSSWWSGYR